MTPYRRPGSETLHANELPSEAPDALPQAGPDPIDPPAALVGDRTITLPEAAQNGRARASRSVSLVSGGRRLPSTTVVIPAYEEGAVVGDVVRDVFETLGPAVDVVVVDDGSSDDTAERAAEAGARVVQMPRNGGNGAAIKAGIRAARGEFVAFMDGDGQHRATDLLRLLAEAGRFDMVVGARHSSTQASRLRRWANAFYNRVASYLTGKQILDLTSGFRVVRRRIAEEFLPLLPNGFSYPTTITLSCFRSGYSVLYVPFEAKKRTGRSKIKMFRDGANFMVIMFKVITLFSPLKIFLPVAAVPTGLALITLGVSAAGLVGLWTVSTILLCSALTLLGLGLISEQICAMRFERLNLAAEQRLLMRGEAS